MEKAFQWMSAGPESAEERSARQSPDSALLLSPTPQPRPSSGTDLAALLPGPDSAGENENKTSKAEKQNKRELFLCSKFSMKT